MSAFKKLLIFGIYCVIFQDSYGRKLYTYEPQWRSSHSTDESKFVEEKILNTYPEKGSNRESIQNAHLFKINTRLSKGSQRKLLQSDNENYSSKLNSAETSLETQVGEHLVKVTSKKESESLSYAPRSDGNEISVNPKYSHIIEIIHRGDNIEKLNKPTLIYDSAVQKQTELKVPDSEKVIKVKINESICKHGETKEGNSEKFEVDEKGIEESDKTEGESEEFEADEKDLEESEEFEADEKDLEEYEVEREMEFCEFDEEDLDECEIEDTKEFEEDHEKSRETERDPEKFEADQEDSDEYDEIEEDAEEFSEDNERKPEDSEETEDSEKFEVDENDEDFIEINEENSSETDKANEGGPEVFEENTVESIKTDERDRNESLPNVIEHTQNFEAANNTKKNGMGNDQTSDDKESSFNEEFEGSGEEFIDKNDQNNTKTGRILGMLSRRNETFPTCTTQRGEPGHCRRLGECLLSEALSNFNGFLQQLCLIRGALVGICCPDNPVIEIVNPDNNATNELSAEEIEQPPEGCGLNTKTRIVGGTISVPHEWTWMVALMRRNRFYCGGVIINNWYILTAAHCVMGMNVKDLTVRLGEYDFNEQSKHIEDLSVSEIKRHAQFVTLTFQHDIALLKLKRSIKYSKFVGSICLPEQKARDYSDVKGTVVGWGTVSFGGAASPVLRQVTVPVWKNEDCDRTYLLENIGDSFMCAGSPEKGEDACQGDSGGPLMTVNENGRWEVIGLVSWGRRCGDPTYPGVYTRVTTYLDWIKQNAA